MWKHALLIGAAVGAVNAAPSRAPGAQGGVAPKPHVLFILVDDLGYADVGFNRAVPSKEVVSPNLDSLVADGIHLTRHYVHQYCTPTRTSVQSGRLPVHVSEGLGSPCGDNTGIAQNMTGFAQKLKSVGYTTAFAGKWDAGMVTPAHTPHGRGYDTSLNYFSHKNDFWSQANMQTCCESDQSIIDFWHTDKGASDVNGTGYSEKLYQDELVGVITKQDPTKPLLIFYTPHVAHCPLQVPKEYYDKFNFMTDDEGKCAAQTVKGLHTIDPHYPDLEYKCRQQYHAMVHSMDDVVGNITAAMRSKGMWDNTLVLMSSDNGGPVDLAENAANNWPKRGGKYSLFEGGISVAAFASGGFIPKALRGTTNNGIIHIADWYSTLCNLAGADPTDHVAAAAVPPVPPIDSIDMWPYLTRQVAVSPRHSKPLPIGKNCIVMGDWKLITTKTSPDFWQGPKFPNTSSLEHFSDEKLQAAPRPYPLIAPCYKGKNQSLLKAQQWEVTTAGHVCSSSPAHGNAPCWNIQGGSHSKQGRSNVILWPPAGTSNEAFTLKAGRFESSGKPGGCVGASGSDELYLYDDCSSATQSNFAYDAEGKTIALVSKGGGQDMCVTASLNGTAGGHPGPGPSNVSFLFNVVADPTEQNNVVADPAQAGRVQAMRTALAEEVVQFWSNQDKFTNDCPADMGGEKDCACWMAKHRYGSFMGPFAMLDMFELAK